jgi:hypothetical protein
MARTILVRENDLRQNWVQSSNGNPSRADCDVLMNQHMVFVFFVKGAASENRQVSDVVAKVGSDHWAGNYG